MRKVCVLTATRAEYGLLKNVIKLFHEDENTELQLVVTGMHLSAEFGNTYQEIENDGFVIDEKIPILMKNDDAEGISVTMGMAMISFGHYFAKKKPDMLVVLGDRYETLAVCMAAMNQGIPIAHIHGGEITEGAIDDAIRHSITKMSHLHFTSTEEYRRRVIQLGEEPERVWCVGAPGVENVLKADLIEKEVLLEQLGVDAEKPYFLCTFHPVTLEDVNDTEKQIDDLLKISAEYKDYEWIYTKANADMGGKMINEKLDVMASKYSNIHVFSSLGMKRYLSAMKYSAGVVGNTSSGILEAPSFQVATINIGDRQKGRTQANSIINCQPNYEEIKAALSMSQSELFQTKLKSVKNPYYTEGTSDSIYKHIVDCLEHHKIQRSKKFYDVFFE